MEKVIITIKTWKEIKGLSVKYRRDGFKFRRNPNGIDYFPNKMKHICGTTIEGELDIEGTFVLPTISSNTMPNGF